jgi:hypothetical protein
VHIVEDGYTYAFHSNGRARDVVPTATITGPDGEVFIDGSFDYGGIYDYHDFSVEKYSTP